jgi:hypothetical protein
MAVGLAGILLAPAPDQEIRAAGAFKLAEAAAAAAGVGPGLRCKAKPVVAARVAAAHLAGVAGIPNSEVAAAAAVVPRQARELLRQPADERLVRAIRLRLALERLVAVEGQRASGPSIAASRHESRSPGR